LGRDGTSAPTFRLDFLNNINDYLDYGFNFLNNINDYLDYEHSGNIHHVEFHLHHRAASSV